MKCWKRCLCALLSALMLFSGCGALAEAAEAPAGQLALADLERMGATAYIHEDCVTFVDGACTDGPVEGMEDAARVVEAMLTLLGGDERTRFEPWRTLEDAAGNRYYVFQQMYANTTVSGGAVKVVADPEGNMLGLVASVEPELPDVEAAEGIAAGRAEAIALEHMAEAAQPGAQVVAGRTQLVILPVNRGIDFETEVEESRFVWAVYTTNPEAGAARGSEFPYLAHYVTMDGEYLYALPTILPGDEAGASGYSAAYVFDFMEPVDYDGTVTLSDGTQRPIHLQLMRDTRTGMVYLGNLERRIAVADCWEFLYNDGRVLLEASADNTGWDETCLLALENYCRAWDYYHAIGWTGGDGEGTPILILKDFCNQDHTPMDNAAYAGKYYGWQVFLSSDANDYSQCLDVLAHEFTHCVTGSVMTYNAYMNDYGAINEAMSDIQGNLCELMMGATEDEDWLMGENSIDTAIRSMSDPHLFDQPEYAWDLYYVAKVKSPTDLNDRGGVHTNSSLLNNTAYRLYADGGMTLEEARAFWFAVDCAMVPGTDYPKLAELMPWVLKHQGMARYMTALEAAMDATRLRTVEAPTAFDDDRALVTLTLPDQEQFGDGNWMLYILSVDVDAAIERVGDILARRGEYAGLLDDLAALLGLDPALLPTEQQVREDPDHAWDAIVEAAMEKLDALLAEEDADALEALFDDASGAAEQLQALYKEYFGDIVYSGTGAAGQDGRTVRMVSQPGVTVPVLFRLEIDSEMKIHSVGLAVYALGSWMDVGTMIAPLLTEIAAAPEDAYLEPYEDAAEPDMPDSDLSGLMDLLGEAEGDALFPGALAALSGDDSSEFNILGWLSDLLFYKVRPGEINDIPSAGLESVAVLDEAAYPELMELFDLAEIMSGEGYENSVDIDYGASDLYSREDMDAAIALIEAEFEGWEGCALHSIRYAGDDCASDENLARLNELGDGSYVRCIEFLSDFHSPVKDGSPWMPDREYTDWPWWLACDARGDWRLLSWGY